MNASILWQLLSQWSVSNRPKKNMHPRACAVHLAQSKELAHLLPREAPGESDGAASADNKNFPVATSRSNFGCFLPRALPLEMRVLVDVRVHLPAPILGTCLWGASTSKCTVYFVQKPLPSETPIVPYFTLPCLALPCLTLPYLASCPLPLAPCPFRLASPRLAFPFPSLPFPLPCTTLPFPSLPFPSLPFPSLPFPSLPFPSLPFPCPLLSCLPYPTLPYPTLPYPSLPFPCLALPSRTPPYHTQPYRTQPNPTQPNPTSPHLTSPHLTSPHLTLPYLTLPYLTLPYLTLPYLTLPYLTLRRRRGFHMRPENWTKGHQCLADDSLLQHSTGTKTDSHKKNTRG